MTNLQKHIDFPRFNCGQNKFLHCLQTQAEKNWTTQHNTLPVEVVSCVTVTEAKKSEIKNESEYKLINKLQKI